MKSSEEGISADVNVHSALQIAKTAPPGSMIVAILCDCADRYLSERFWTQKNHAP